MDNNRAQDKIARVIRRHYPWLVADFNGATWESRDEEKTRRIIALEAHVKNLEERYAEMENRFNEHAQGTRHRTPKPVLPPDQ